MVVCSTKITNNKNEWCGDERKKKERNLNLDRIAPNHDTAINNLLSARNGVVSTKAHEGFLIDEINDVDYWKNCAQIRITTSSFDTAVSLEPIKLSDTDVFVKKANCSMMVTLDASDLRWHPRILEKL